MSDQEFIQQSIESNLIYCGSILEFTYSLSFRFLEKDDNIINELNNFFDKFKIQMLKTINIANGNISQDLIDRNILYSKYTIPLYNLAEQLTATEADTKLIEELMRLKPGIPIVNDSILNIVDKINQDTLKLLNYYYDFITYITKQVSKFNAFIFKYALYIEDVKKRTSFYIENLTRIINRQNITTTLIDENIESVKKLMERNALFINGFINQSEKKEIEEARYFEQKYNNITLNNNDIASYKEAYDLTNNFIEFITSLIKRLLNKKVQFIMGPAYLDICLREANDFKYNLELLINKKT